VGLSSSPAWTLGQSVNQGPKIAHVTTIDLTLNVLLLGQLRALRDAGYEVIGISAAGPWVGTLEAEGIRHVPWPHATRSWDPMADARAFAELVGILRRERVDLVHTHNPKPGIMGRIGGRLAGVPCVVNTVHGLYATRTDPLAKRAAVLSAEWLASRFSDLELYQSEEDLSWALKSHVARPDRTHLLGNGTDLVRFDPGRVSPEQRAAIRRDLSIPDSCLVVGTIGRLVLEKGYREFFAAARAIRESRPDVRFIAVGDIDTHKADAVPVTDIEDARDHVLVTGWREDIPELLAAMDVFVLASWREGLPRSAIEAAAMGKPLVVTDIRGCREVVRDGLEGFLVPPRDAPRLAGAIERLVSDPPLRQRMGAAARARAIERFDEARVADAVAAWSQRLLQRKQIGPTVDRDMPSGLRIRRARPADASAVARIHARELPNAFLPTLGEPFLVQLYRSLASFGDAGLFVAENGVGVVGFAAAVPSVGRFYRRFLARRGIPAFAAALPRLVDPGVARRAWETARYPASTQPLPDAELLAIAVRPGSRTTGVGRALATASLNVLALQGVREAKVVVQEDNEAANRFYEGVGFEFLTKLSVHDNRRSNVWVRRISA
jgi:glycosyltransferase involved in cell wall biosynthesis/ribosomal protein S18 acetylase RimI-like enzyme